MNTMIAIGAAIAVLTGIGADDNRFHNINRRSNFIEDDE